MSKHRFKVGDKLLLGDGGRAGYERYEGMTITVTGLAENGYEPYYRSKEMVGGTWDGWVVGLAPIGDPDDTEADLVNHPPHYTSDPSGVECIQITRHRNFNIGNAIKYIWRLGLKESAGKTAKEKTLQDIDKAIWYLQDERKRIEAE